MKRTLLFLFILAISSAISGYLMSKASWIGKVGMTFFYKEYNLLKIWWQGAIAVYLVLMVLFTLHFICHRKLPVVTSRLLNLVLMVIALGGLYFTYDDFRTDFSHRLLGSRFHYGFYLFWVDWALICFFFIFSRKKQKTTTETGKTPKEQGKMEQAMQ